MKFVALSVLVFIYVSLTAQSQDLIIDIPSGAKPWTSLDLNNDDQQFQIAIVTDRTGGHRPGVFMDGVRKLNLLQPEFVMSVGDLIEGYSEDLSTLKAEWKEFNGFIDSLEMPFFYVPGNHDITNKVMEELYLEKFGKTYYHFVYKDVLFLCLNSEDQCRGAGKGSISDEQYGYIENTLNNNADVRWTLVFMHQPLWNQENPERWPDVESLLSDRKHTVFTGHVHHYTKEVRNNGKYFTLATTGGGSRLNGPQFGEFDHVTWLTMTEDGPVLANLQLEGIWSENVSTVKTRTYFVDMVRSNCVQIEPLYVSAENWSQGQMQIKLINDFDVPMQVELKGSFNWDLSLTLEKGDYLIQPNSVEMISAKLSGKRKNLTLDDVRAVKLKVKVSLQSEELPDIKIPMTYYLAPESKYLLKTRNTQIRVDGDLSDWNPLPFRLHGSGDNDCRALFDMTFDEDYLYLAAKIFDEDVQANAMEAIWDQDFIGVIINADPMRISASDRGAGRYRESFFFMQSPDSDSIQRMSSVQIEGVVSECTRSDHGYTLETAIPINFIKEKQGENWQTIRCNLVVQDVDAGESQHPGYTFKPDWRGIENRPGSGMFFRGQPRPDD